ncbi:hypothetical protein PM082_014553 [Marasmius tenuissimus]|nr:hypothetical protein PM082_014553 [Marasmius tenuissimus]
MIAPEQSRSNDPGILFDDTLCDGIQLQELDVFMKREYLMDRKTSQTIATSDEVFGGLAGRTYHLYWKGSGDFDWLA